jgi:hypothetical protein
MRPLAFALLAVPLLVVGPAAVPARSEAAPPARPPAEIPRDHWAYDAIRALASRGLVHGYRDDRFLGVRILTRFEMASLVKRVLDNWVELAGPEGVDRALEEQPGTAAARGQRGPEDAVPTGHPLPTTAPRVDFQPEDLDLTRRLVDEFSVELAVIGADLSQGMSRLEALERRVGQLEQSAVETAGPLQRLIQDVARIDRVRFVGYIQSRYESFEHTREAVAADGRPSVADRFTNRRVRLTANARPTDRVGLKWQFDGAPSALETRDAWIDYFFTGNPATGYTASFGQMKIPFGFEVVQSSSVREHPERARIARHYYPGERDRGAKLASPTGGRYFWEVGVFNGKIGPGRPGLNANDNNNDKTVAGRIRTTTLNRRLDLGLSADYGRQLWTSLPAPYRGVTPTPQTPVEATKFLLGADFQWFPRPGTKLQGEYVWGQAAGVQARGYILQLAHDLDRKHQLVVKYDWFGADRMVFSPVGAGGTPIGDSVPYDGTLSNLTLGVIRRLDASTRIKLMYEINGIGRPNQDYGPVPWQGNVARLEVITVF